MVTQLWGAALVQVAWLASAMILSVMIIPDRILACLTLIQWIIVKATGL